MKRDSLNSDLLLKLVTKIMLNKELRKMFVKMFKKTHKLVLQFQIFYTQTYSNVLLITLFV